MADSPGKKPQKRRSSFDADLDAMLDEAELSLSPIDDLLDEDAIDRLLIDDGFDRQDDGQAGEHHKLEPTMEDALNAETEPDDLVEDLSVIQTESDADEIDLRLDEASAELEQSTDHTPSQIVDEPVELASEIEPTATQEPELDHNADEIDMRLDLADTEPELSGSTKLPDEDDLVYQAIAEPENSQPIETTDALDLKLQQVSEELELPLDSEDALLEPEIVEQTASSIERLGSALLDDEHQEVGSALSDDLVIENVDSDEDFISMMLDQEAELATDIDEAYDNQLNDLKTQVTEQDEAKAVADDLHTAELNLDEPETTAQPLALSETDNPALDFESDDDFDLVDQADSSVETATVDTEDLDPESAELEEEVLAFGAFADDDWHTAEPSAEPDKDGTDLISQDESQLDEQAGIIDEQLDEPLAEASELDDIDFSALADSVGDDTFAEVEQEEVMDEFGDEFGDEDAESALAKQIEESLLADTDDFADDSFDAADDQPDEIDELNALEVIDDEFSDIPNISSEIDEFSDDDLLIGVDLADLDTEPAAPEQIEALISDEADESGLEDDDFLMADFDISVEQDSENSSENPYGDDAPILDEPIATDFESNELDNSDFDDDLGIKPIETAQNDTPINEAAVAALALAEFKSEQESFNKQQKKLIADLESKTKKSNIVTYTALGFGLIAMSVAGYLGFVAHSAKNEANRLNEVIVGLEKKLQELPAKPVESTPEAVDELPENADLEPDELIEAPEHAKETKQTQQHGKTPLAAPVTENELEHKSATTDNAPKESPSEHAEKSEPAKAEVKQEPAHEDSKETVKAENKQDKATKAEEIVVPKKKIIFVDEKAATKEVNEKPAEPVAEKKLPEAPKKAVPVPKPVKPPVKKKPVKTETIVKNEPVVIKKLQSGGDWSVNLIAFKQDWYAKGKANEFRQKGIPVDIVPVQIDNVTWYRVRVNGFNGRADANAYAERVKKALNLSSVWVGK